MFDMFCKVHFRFCFMVYTLFFCFHRHSCRRNKRFQDKKYDLLSKTWSLFFVRFTLRGLFNRALAATCILLFCSLYVSSLVRSFKVSLIDFISSTHWTHGPCFFVGVTLRGWFIRALPATCILLPCSLYVSSLERSFEVSLIDFYH